jgi:hypothetical protein
MIVANDMTTVREPKGDLRTGIRVDREWKMTLGTIDELPEIKFRLLGCLRYTRHDKSSAFR